MRAHPGASAGRPFILRSLLLLSVAAGLAGCARTADFGRDPSAVSYAEESAPGTNGSASPLTDDERHLRDLARNLLASPGEQSRSLLGPAPSAQDAHASGRYVQHLVQGPFRSSVARYSRLIDDTRNDIVRIEPFFLVARRVADLDMRRRRAVPYVTGLTAAEERAAERRLRENMMLIAEVHRVMSERAAMYRTALERLVVALPSPLAVEAERQRHELERRLREIRVFAAPRPALAAAGAPAQ